ncbi:Protein phosphatase Slingshot [Pseudolycoriella hygida]|uniref:protein-serine/threonine phosphatase n=1 Tax=Pseudolycoriella hygida TaxID=35572 RepID=A0A9Q0MXL8_9DIPT|nr:Protein phosphatase Slingshot [Pseudolycoriella hygida]
MLVIVWSETVDESVDDNSSRKNVNEYFFAGKGAAVVLESNDESDTNVQKHFSEDSQYLQSFARSDIQRHLQSMFYLLREEETLKMAVKLETARTGRTRYLVVVSRLGKFSRQHQQQNTGRYNTKNYASSSFHADVQSKSSNRKQMDHFQSDAVRNSDIFKVNEMVDVNSRFCQKNSDDYDYDVDVPATSEVEESCLLGIDCNEKTTVGLVLKILADTTIRLDGDGGFSITVYGRTHIFKPVSVQAMWSALQTLHKVSGKARRNNFYPGGPSHEWVSYYEDRIESERSCLNEWNAMDSLESRRPPSPDAVRNKPTERGDTEHTIKTALKEIMMSVDLDEVTSKYIRGRLEEHLDMDLGEFKSFIDQEMLTILGQMDSPTEIFDHVYLGSEWNASNLEELQKNGVRHILNVTREIDNFFPGMFDYFNIRVYDDEKTNLLKHWDNTFKYITRARKEGSKVLVHCKMGVSRSASVVIAYAMKAFSWNFDQAMIHVKKKRNCIKPNKSFLSQLETYEGMLDAMRNKEKLQRSKSETNLHSTKDARLLPGSEPTPLIQALNAAEKLHSPQKRSKSRRKRPSSWSPPKNVEKVNFVPKQFSQSKSLENLTSEPKMEKTKNVLLPCNGKNYSVSQNQVVHLQENFKTVPSVKWIVNELEACKTVQRIRAAEKQSDSQCSYSYDETTTSRQDTWDPGEISAFDKVSKPNKTLTMNLDSSSCDSPTWTSTSQTKFKLPIGKRDKQTTIKSDPFSSSHLDNDDKKHKGYTATLATTSTSPLTQSLELRSSQQQSSRKSMDSPSGSNRSGRTSRFSSWSSSEDNKSFTSINSGHTRGGETINQSRTFPFVDDVAWQSGAIRRTKFFMDKSSVTKRINDDTSTCFINTKKKSAINATNPWTEKLNKSLANKITLNRCNSEQNLNTNQLPSINSRLSVSTPETTVEYARPILYDDNKQTFRKVGSSPSSQKICGIVQNLKMNFEQNDAFSRFNPKLAMPITLPATSYTSITSDRNVDMAFSMDQSFNSKTSKPIAEEINVKNLVDKYEITKSTKQSKQLLPVKSRPRSVYETKQQMHQLSKSHTISSHPTFIQNMDEYHRPPVPPTNQNKTITQSNPIPISKSNVCKRMQQHGKTHPLSRLGIPKQRLNAAAYNTM